MSLDSIREVWEEATQGRARKNADLFNLPVQTYFSTKFTLDKDCTVDNKTREPTI